MPRKNKINTNLILNIINIVIAICLIIAAIWAFFKYYNPKLQSYIKGSKYAFDKIQLVSQEIHKKQGYIFKENNPKSSEFCTLLAKKYAKGAYYCNDLNPGFIMYNFNFKNTKIEVFGLEKPAYMLDGVMVKDIIIDTNGEKTGENTVGIDRTIIRIYSTGRLGGLLSPVNCDSKEEAKFGFKKSILCAGSDEVNYLAKNTPLGFDVAQIGGEEGITKIITKNVDFLRADCAAFGGEMLALDDYCDSVGDGKKAYYWLPACYDEYPCAVYLAK